mmetsp:Transcript_28814/g.43514  ORF Transcript_28814/g.43514 Transcript_28814/m.43514 type:complete len:118 (+) Transcript_28814:1578-1931(+)
MHSSSIIISEKSASDESEKKPKKRIRNNLGSGSKKPKKEPEDYKFLGNGRLGSLVVQGKHLVSGKKVAIKVIKKKGLTTTQVERVRDMIEMYKIIYHDGIIQLEDFFETKDTFFICL